MAAFGESLPAGRRRAKVRFWTAIGLSERMAAYATEQRREELAMWPSHGRAALQFVNDRVRTLS